MNDRVLLYGIPLASLPLEAQVKILILATALTLMMLSPGKAVDVPDLPESLLVASKQTGNDHPPVLVIKGEGGRVTGVEKGGRGTDVEKSGKDKKKKKRK